MFTDTHCHLADSQFDADRAAVIQRARDAGVATFIEIAESPEMWEAAVALSEKHPFVYASLGIHPHHAHLAGPAEWPALAAKLRKLLQHPKVMAIGEFGLDYFRMQNTKEQQDYLFRQQLNLARELGKPVVIHCRDAERPSSPGSSVPPPLETGSGAHEDVRKVLVEYYPEKWMEMDCPRPAGVVHCFSGTWDDAQTYMAHGFMLGFDGPVTYPSAKLLQENVARMPLQRMVLETDSPYLPPQSHRGKRNEPLHIPVIAEAIGSIKHATPQDVAASTSQNARALFRLG